MYNEVPHVEFNGARIYHPDVKMDVLRSQPDWTRSKVQRHFKVGHAAAMHLINYAQWKGVLTQINSHAGVIRYVSKTEGVE
ncbi:hypothetical protein NVP1251O_09 [Vibrio phage 1.251.O._10N.261.55.E5]|nr:hypothetical protein NVP1251O_09 [Vibrio phage 1.251.O._10N.261.55.E5]